MIQYSENSRREMTNAEAGVVGAVLGFGLIALLLYLAVDRYHIRKEQLAEAGLYLFVIAAAVIAPVLRKFTTRGNWARFTRSLQRGSSGPPAFGWKGQAWRNKERPMRYEKGTMELSPARDIPLLPHVLRSGFVTGNQLYEFMRLEQTEGSRQAFDHRVRRLVGHGLNEKR